jgi:bifunctional non-homologous end joining protein LigD
MSSETDSGVPLGFIEPCLPWVSLRPPPGGEWLHEVKHPGHRLMARRIGNGVRLFARRGEDWTDYFPNIVETVQLLPVKSCIIDGVVGCDGKHKVTADSLRGKAPTGDVEFYAFDLLEVNGFDLRRDEIENRKRALAHLLGKAHDTVRFNPHFEHDGEAVLHQACRMGFDGIVSKRRGSRYLSGRCTNWLFSKRLDVESRLETDCHDS